MIFNVRFDAVDLRVFLDYLDSKVSANQARWMYPEMRRFPKEMLRFCGKLCQFELIEPSASIIPNRNP